jgi:hypothetical protein
MVPFVSKLQPGHFQSLRPFKVELPLFHSPHEQRVVDFFIENGDARVDVTDQCGQFVESINLRRLHAWWGGDQADLATPALALGNVVHWSIVRETRTIRPPFCTFSEVTAFLSSAEPALISLFDEYPFPMTPEFSWIILGPSGTEVSAHRDMFHTASWNLLYSGQKTWQFWMPLHQSTNGIAADMELEQMPGELVWIPEGWWHRVRYQVASICLSRNLLLRRSLAGIMKELKACDVNLSNIVEAILLVEQRKTHDSSVTHDKRAQGKRVPSAR